MINRILNKRIGHSVYLARKRNKMNQKHLADLLGIEQSALSRIEKGTQNLTAFQVLFLRVNLKYRLTIKMDDL